MAESDPNADLHRYLRRAREAVLWKLDGLSEYDVRRPLTPTGTNLLGLVKHLATMEYGYFGDCFGRPPGEPLPWVGEDAEPNADLWATAGGSRPVVDRHRRGDVAPDPRPHGLRDRPARRARRHRQGTHRRRSRAFAGQRQHEAGDRAWWEAYRSRL